MDCTSSVRPAVWRNPHVMGWATQVRPPSYFKRSACGCCWQGLARVGFPHHHRAYTAYTCGMCARWVPLCIGSFDFRRATGGGLLLEPMGPRPTESVCCPPGVGNQPPVVQQRRRRVKWNTFGEPMLSTGSTRADRLWIIRLPCVVLSPRLPKLLWCV